MDFVDARILDDATSGAWQRGTYRQRRISAHILSVIAPLVDLALLFFSLGFICWLQRWNTVFSSGEMLLSGGVAILVTWLSLSNCGAYRVDRISGKEQCLSLVGGAVGFGALIFALALEMLPTISTDRLPDVAIRSGAWAALSLFALAGVRVLSAYIFSAWDLSATLRRRVAVVVGCDLGRAFTDRIANDPEDGFEIVGVYDDLTPEGYTLQGRDRSAGDFVDLAERCDRGEVDVVILAVPLLETRRIDRIRYALRNVSVDICVAADIAGLDFGVTDLAAIGQTPVVNVRGRPLDDTQLLQKAIFDRLLSGLLLLFLLPIFTVVALAIRLDSPGPVLFRQPRVGFSNRVFMVYKFRTMFHRGDRASLDGSDQARRNDPRITRVGKILRKYSIDELPQLLNVIRGEMSIVGPRPHPLNTRVGDRQLHEVVDNYATRHRVLPGITGWAQVNGWRGETVAVEQVEQRVAHDLYYIDNWSLAFDVRIILLTLVKEIVSKSAF